MRTRLYRIYIAACMGALLIAGCSADPETEPIPDSESAEISKAAGIVSSSFTGPETARIGCSVTYSGMANQGYINKWEFGKMDADQNFTPMPNEIQVVTSNSTTYTIVILAAPGTYTIRRTVWNGGAGFQFISSQNITVPSEGQAQIVQYFPWRSINDDSIIYSSGGIFTGSYRMEAAYWIRTFSYKPSTANVCYNYMIPVYKVSGLTKSTYQMNAPTSGSYSIPFYLFSSKRPGTVPVYLFKEYYTTNNGALPIRKYTGNNYFSTTSTDPGIRIPASGPAIYAENAGIVGYAFPVVTQ